jgi:exodeoxyribonuclease V gamma subunit
VLEIHRAERADGLVDGLATILAEPLADPFAPEVVAVPRRGMERWLTQRLSARLGCSPGRRDGVCANVSFPFPGRLIAGAVATATGVDPERDPWQPRRAVWQLIEVVERSLREPWLATLAAHLRAGARGTEGKEVPHANQISLDPTAADDAGASAAATDGRRYSTLQRIADLYDHYGIRRPAMVRAWARGEDSDGSGHPLASDTVWQAELWRRLRTEIAQPSPAERLDRACSALREDPMLCELPSRISLFGLTRMPASYLQLLSALAGGRDVHLFLLHPSPALWEAVATAIAGGRPAASRAQDRTARLPANRLLASWGHDARELQLVISSVGAVREHHHDVAHGTGTLLARIQADIRADRAPPGAPLPGRADARHLLVPEDLSLQVHACHGPARQVEVLRDAVLHLLAEQPSLEPRDVIVMCPDIERFAPLIQATFGARDVRDEPDEKDDGKTLARPSVLHAGELRVRLADRSLRQTNPVLGVVARLLELASERVTASQLLDLADREPVRRRFGLDDDDLARIQDWVATSGIRWGLDAAHREPFKLSALTAGTWRAGLDRILLGVTMTEDRQPLFADVLPLDDVDSGAIDLVGRFAEFVDRTHDALDALSAPQSLERFTDAIAAAADGLTATAERDSWQRDELQRLLDEVSREAAGAAGRTTISPSELRALLAHRLQGRPTRANFRTGHLTICTLVPMRSVPHRAVCLLGLDNGAFPRSAPRNGDDLLLADPHIGDRDPRLEDRQMLLDALMAATDRLIVTYSGNDERTNAPLAPAVPLGELLDLVDQTARTEGAPARERVLVHHRLQPFDPGNFAAESPWSFDRVALEGARTVSSPRRRPEPFLSRPLPDAPSPILELDRLVGFVERPIRAFLRQRLGIAVSDFFEDVEDALPVELDGLSLWAVGQRLLDGALAGSDLDLCIAAETARGSLPPGSLAGPVIARIRPVVEELGAAARSLQGDGALRSREVKLALDDGRMLTGTVPSVRGGVLESVSYARVGARHRLAGWVRLLALSASHAAMPFAAVTVGRAMAGADDARLTIARIRPVGAERARHHLTELVDLYDRGMREPLPLACQTAAAYAAAAGAGGDAVVAARRQWESSYGAEGENGDPAHRLVFGGVVKLERLLEPDPRAGEEGVGWDEREPTRFGRLARRLWDPLRAQETLDHR